MQTRLKAICAMRQGCTDHEAEDMRGMQGYSTPGLTRGVTVMDRHESMVRTVAKQQTG